jgi:threonine dehydrogenase-like Zn-dependent dehydrogenase
MRAVSCRAATLSVVDLPKPTLERGQLLLDVLACGICGSDLHARHHCDEMADATAESGFTEFMRSDQDVVMGHEFCGRIVEHGPGTRKRDAEGTTVVAFPLMRRGGTVLPTGLTARSPGGYAEQVVVEESLAMAVPNGLHHDLAAMTEPMAVGLHAVEKAQLDPNNTAMVFGCGPVGLAVIAALKLKGVGPIIAADFSPARRKLAEVMGADIVVDPAKEDPYVKLAPAKRAAVFECVGVPGLIQQTLEKAPRDARIVVVGVCMELDTIEPMFGIVKELSLQFVLGYTPDEFARSLRLLAEGQVDAPSLITAKVGLDGVKGAFQELGNPEKHTKILVEPWR